MLWRLLRGLRRNGPPRRMTPEPDADATLQALYARGRSLEDAGDHAGALKCYHEYAARNPHDLGVRAAIANALSASWRMEECIAACEAGLRVAPSNASVFSCYLMYSHFAARPDARALFEGHAAYGECMRNTAPPRYSTYPDIAPDPGRTLSIGYVSRDFCQHSVASFIEPVLEHHDRSRFRVYCYYTRAERDAVTDRIARCVDVWRDEHLSSADQLAQRIHEDRIDLLVDLGGHTFGGTLPVFARRPAPVQVTWLGYPDTTGLAAVDYRITDAVADPALQADALHTERLLRLEPPFLCYRPPHDSPAIGARGAVRGVVFGSFNVIMKVNEPLLDLWAQILHAVPDSRMLIKSTLLEHAETRRRVSQRFAARGIVPDRVELRAPTPDRSNHLAAYNEVDIALDTFPYNGTTTTCEALWMGTPVVSLAGNVHMARVGATLLESTGLRELVAHTRGEYVALAVALARDRARREALAGGMRQRLERSPLFDYAGFTRKLEAALREAWSTWCGTQAPRD